MSYGLANWFKNLGKPEELPVSVESFKHSEYMLSGHPDLHQKYKELAYKRDNEALRSQLARALSERKTASVADFAAQLTKVLEANAALVHQKLLGVNENSEMTKIVNSNFREELAKLKFLVYEDITMTEEEAVIRINQYMDSHETT